MAPGLCGLLALYDGEKRAKGVMIFIVIRDTE